MEDLDLGKLSPTHLEELMRRCLYTTDEVAVLPKGQPPEGAVLASGVYLNVAFHPERVAAEGNNIWELLDELPREFHKDGGGGWSFLNAVVDKDGNHWGEHPDLDTLLCLGIAIGAIEYLVPRPLWAALPGGVPYFVVKARPTAH